MKEVQFYRGLFRNYNASLYPDVIYFATDTKEILVNGISYGTVDVDDVLTAGGTNPVAGNVIYAAITASINDAFSTNRIGSSLAIAKIGNSGAYQLTLLDQNGNELSKVLFVGSEKEVDAGGLVVSRISNSKLFIREGEKALIKFNYDVINNSGDSLGTPGKAKVRIDVPEGAGKDSEFEVDLEADAIATIDITDYLIEGLAVKCYIDVTSTYRGETVTTDTIVTTAWLVNLNLTSDFDISTVTNKGNTLTIPFSVSGINAAKTLMCYVDGELYEEKGNAFYTSPAPGSFNINTGNLSHGSHSVQLVARYDITEDGIVTGQIFSNSIYFSVIVVEEGNNSPVIASRFDFSDGRIIQVGNPYFTVEQYDIFNISYYAYDTNMSRNVDFYSNNELVGNNTVTDAPITISYKYNQPGNKNCYLQCGNSVLDFDIIVNTSQYQIEEPTSGLKLYLDALGKSNSSSNRDSWTFEEITSNFEGFTWGGDGWINSALRLIGGDKVTINYKPLQQLSTSKNAFALSIKFKVDNVNDENEELITCLDGNNTGFVIKANEALIRTNSNTLVSTKFAAGEVYNIGFVSFPITYGDNYGMLNANMLYLYVNGVICGSAMKGANDSIYLDNPLPIVLQSKSATLDVYSIRAYDTLLTDDLMFNCYLVDLSDSELFASEYLQNDVLDLTGNISVADVYGKIPYVIVTGNYEGLNMVQHAAVMNDKDFKYDVDLILYVDGANPEYNFVVEASTSAKPLIRLQGTSSLSYPRKNYRLYSKKATLKVGCDSNGIGGTEAKDALYAMSENAAPVNCWCLKADYAESSSSHNTGFANMVHEVLTTIGDLTPAQKHKNDNYPYEVRTTIEGHPCLLFARNTLDDAPVFAGKFNFNNDKSTEAVFGFLDINGYHTESDYVDTLAELAEKSLIFPEDFVSVEVEGKTYDKAAILKILNNNPTECWEFLNNGNEFGIFKRTDFSTIEISEPDEKGKTKEYIAWMGCWEARFPDEDILNAAFEAGVKPFYLERLAKWINSTDTLAATNDTLNPSVTYVGTTYTHDTPEYRAAKFKYEVRDYFDLNFLCDYYIMNDCIAGADQRVKNMMFAFWYDPEYSGSNDGILCYPIYYDNDTINGINNAGVIAINWDADEETKYESGAYVFAGHDSVLWKNLREQCVSELEAAFLRVRSSMTNLTMFRYFDDYQSELYGERIFNKDTLYKYITPGSIGVDRIDPDTGEIKNHKYGDQALFVQGTRKAHRHWFISNRMNLFDARYRSSNYLSNEINFKGQVDKVGCSITAIPARDYYFSIYADVINGVVHNKVLKDTPWTYTHDKTLGVGDIFHLCGISWMKELDLSNWGGFNSFNITNPMPVLEKFIVCGKNTTAALIPSLELSSNTPLLKYLDVSNIVGGGEDGRGKLFSDLDLQGCLYLETVIAEACPNLTTINFAEGCSITRMVLPENYLNLILKGLPNLTNSGIEFEVNASKVRLLVIDNCPNIKLIELLNSIMNVENNKLSYIRLTNLSLRGNGSDLIAIMNRGIKGIDSTGRTITDYCTLIGEYRLTTLLEDSVYLSLKLYFRELDIQLPTYTEIQFDLSEDTYYKISNMDNQTGRLFTEEYKPSGYITKILNKRHSYLVKNSSERGVFNVAQLSDTDSNLYNDGSVAVLDGSQGDYCGYEPHYWYKGVNDHKNRIIHAYFSDLESVPTNHVGLKVAVSDCEVKKGYKVSTSNSYSKVYDALLSDGVYMSYIYTLPNEHNYKQFRVNTIASSQIGVLVADAEGNILLRLNAADNTGMFNKSYLFDTLPVNAKFIYFTTDNTSDYCLYLTESEDIEAIEPDWVEHKEEFVGKLLSVPYNGAINSALLTNANNGYYPTDANNMSIYDICRMFENVGYYPFDYEAYKNIILLAYAKYGHTGLHVAAVGAGAGANGQGTNYTGRYFPNAGKDYTKYGMEDTQTSGIYDSYYTLSNGQPEYPYVATLMGYHLFVCQGTTCSNNDVVEINKTYRSNRTGRTVTLYPTSTSRYISHIQGGRYLDLFGVTHSTGTPSTGFCAGEDFTRVHNGNAGRLSIGVVGNNNSKLSISFTGTQGIPSASITLWALSNVQRLLIVPDKINFITNSSEFKAL